MSTRGIIKRRHEWRLAIQNLNSDWRVVPYFPRYKVGKDGSVWSYRHDRHEHGYWRRMIGQTGKYGHNRVFLFNGFDKKAVYTHRLVLEVFKGPCPKGKECCHKDDNPKNNTLSNLYWGTRKENVSDKYKNKKGEVGRKLKCKEVLKIRRMYKNGWFQKDIAVVFGISRDMVMKICNHSCWAHI